jgi:hypothetical protein
VITAMPSCIPSRLKKLTPVTEKRNVVPPKGAIQAPAIASTISRATLPRLLSFSAFSPLGLVLAINNSAANGVCGVAEFSCHAPGPGVWGSSGTTRRLCPCAVPRMVPNAPNWEIIANRSQIATAHQRIQREGLPNREISSSFWLGEDMSSQ